VHANIKAGHDQFAIFELGKIHCKGVEDEEGLPQEDVHLGFVFASDNKTAAQEHAGAAYYVAKRYLTEVLPEADAMLAPLADFDLGDDVWGRQMVAPYEPGRSAVLVKDGMVWGVVGEFKVSVRRALKLPDYTAGFELGLDLLSGAAPSAYMPLPRFPSVEQDISLKVPAGMSYAELYNFVEEHLGQNRPGQTRHSLGPIDIYQREDDPGHKQITLRLSIASYERTLTDQEVNNLLDQVAQAAKEKFNAERI